MSRSKEREIGKERERLKVGERKKKERKIIDIYRRKHREKFDTKGRGFWVGTTKT